MSTSENAIEIHGLKKSFGEIEALRGIDLTVARGEMFGIVGPDGAGKTTLIRTLCGILKPESGSVRVLGLELATQLGEIKKRIGYLSQRFTLYPDLSVDENIEFFAEIHEVKDYKTRRNELLEFTRLTPFRTRLADKLSGGMKQKLALACTLVHTPDIIFLDEPTTGVDPVSRRDFWKILSELLKNGITILMATPYLDEAERCSRVALMTGGEILIADTPQNVKHQMKEKIVEIVAPDIHRAFDTIKRMPAAKEVQAFGDRLNVVIAADHNESEIERYLKSEGIEVTQVRIVQPSLENVFISLMRQEAKTDSPLLEKERV
jgi:ABC-2 type transport system ATP-binding protein